MEDNNPQNEDEITLLDYLIVILKHKKLIISVTVGVALITALIAFLMPEMFRGETRILPPQQDRSSLPAQFLGQISAIGIPASTVGAKNTNDLYIGLLKSRAVLDRIIDRFDLMKLYRKKYREDTRRALTKSLNLQNDKKSSMITIGVEDRNPERAADMANAFVEELKHLTNDLAFTEAAQRRLFFEEQLKNIKEDLVKAEESMKGFQESTGAIEMKEQTKALIEAGSHLKAQIAAKEVEVKVMKTYATPNNPDLQKAEETLAGLKAELSKLEAKDGSGYDPLMPAGRMPATGTVYVRKLRDLKYFETLFELMAKQYESAKIDEAKDAVVVQVVDKALPPEKRIRPKRTFLVVTGAIAGLFGSIILAFFMEYRERMSGDPGNKEKLENLKRYASSWNRRA